MLRIELDLDEHGDVERGDFSRPDRTVETVGLASRNDGVLDSPAVSADDGRGMPQRRCVSGVRGEIARVEIDPECDGTFVIAPRRAR